MERKIPAPGEFYRHFKNKLYQITAVAEHTETGERLVIYQALYGDFRIYARPLSMFLSPVDREKYPDAAQAYRFEQVELSKDSEIFLEQKEEVKTEKKEEQVNPWLLKFLETDEPEEQLAALEQMKKRAGRREISSLCTIFDVQIPDEDRSSDPLWAEEQIEVFEKIIKTRMKYDGTRLR